MRVIVDLDKGPEFEYFNGEKVPYKMMEEYTGRSAFEKKKRPLTATLSPGNTRNIRRFSETHGKLEFQGAKKDKVIDKIGTIKIVKSPRKKPVGIPFDRFNEELTTVDLATSRAMS
jgi:hypothetical protein